MGVAMTQLALPYTERHTLFEQLARRRSKRIPNTEIGECHCKHKSGSPLPARKLGGLAAIFSSYVSFSLVCRQATTSSYCTWPQRSRTVSISLPVHRSGDCSTDGISPQQYMTDGRQSSQREKARPR